VIRRNCCSRVTIAIYALVKVLGILSDGWGEVPSAHSSGNIP